ncbi:unnamed protein product [Pleuronectes platessa]|uniref:Uncharacterized protein n=1 Tax=Pleuronectes platessa TaxID=8262 RepID=A0A9N7UY96_PLEPL|nr:unnamed protein product [Pleuronectes platessa]
MTALQLYDSINQSEIQAVRDRRSETGGQRQAVRDRRTSVQVLSASVVSRQRPSPAALNGIDRPASDATEVHLYRLKQSGSDSEVVVVMVEVVMVVSPSAGGLSFQSADEAASHPPPRSLSATVEISRGCDENGVQQQNPVSGKTPNSPTSGEVVSDED